MIYRNKPVKDKWVGLFEFLDYCEDRVKYAHKVWIGQDFMETIDKIYEFLEIKEALDELTNGNK